MKLNVGALCHAICKILSQKQDSEGKVLTYHHQRATVIKKNYNTHWVQFFGIKE